MFPNDTVPVFNGCTFQTNLVGPIKHFPIHSILFHANKCTSLASYHLSLYVINWDQNSCRPCRLRWEYICQHQ